jgi:cytochrome P450
MLAMVAFPESQRRAQAELDAVVGRSRILSFSDLPCLPYLHAMVKEVLRWRSVLPVGIPHCSLEDDWYEGMFIPKGTMCLVNVGLCNHHPAIYGDDATLFDPSRHLNPDGTLAPLRKKSRVSRLRRFSLNETSHDRTGKSLSLTTAPLT